VADTFSLNHGAHWMKMGVDFQHVLLRRQTFTPVTGAFDFIGVNAGLGLTTTARSTLAWADFLLDQPDQVREPVTALPGIRPGAQFARLFGWRLHNFFNDDWKVSPKLTLNVGLRWELNSPIRDIRGLTPNFSLATGQIVPPAGTPGNLYNWDRHDFAARLGLAFRPFGGDKTVVRASYGVFYNVNMWNNITVMTINPPFNISINQLNNPGQVTIRMANANQATIISGLSAPEVLGVLPDYGLGNAQQWSFNIQRALPRDMFVELGYMGSKSTHFDRPAEYNLINALAGQTTRALPQSGDVEFIDTDASGNYNALIAKVEKRFSQGFSFLFSHTFSKTMFDSFAGNGANRLSNPFNAKAEKGLAECDQRHRVTSSFLFLRSQPGVAGHLLGGWQANGVFTFETGMPFYVLQTLQPVNDGCPRSNRRPDRIANSNLAGDQRSLSHWFDNSALSLAVGHYGNSGRDILTAPGLINLDFSLFKNFRVSESKRVEFRWRMLHQHSVIQSARRDHRHRNRRSGHQHGESEPADAVRAEVRILRTGRALLPLLPAASMRHSGGYIYSYYAPPAAGSPWRPAWSPDGKELAFSMAGSIRKICVGEKTARELTANRTNHSSPAWSPDGRWIVYTSEDERGVDLMLLNVATGESALLTSGGDLNLDPAWSPDGARLAFVRNQPAGQFHIYLMPVENGRPGGAARITEPHDFGPGRFDFGRYDDHVQAAWSPDGGELLLVSNRGISLGSGAIRLARAEPDCMRGARMILCEETLYRTQPQWSPDGKRILYASHRGRKYDNLYLLPVEGGEPYQLTHDDWDHSDPRWPPDGEWIAYVSNQHAVSDLRLLRVAGGEERKVEIRRGRTFVTNGLLLSFEVNGEIPGGEIRLPRAAARWRLAAGSIPSCPWIGWSCT
jgi:hypothetical protein